jgi:carboxylesterase type B
MGDYSLVYSNEKKVHCIFRWSPPVPVTNWSPEVLNATARAPACPQPACFMPSDLCLLMYAL